MEEFLIKMLLKQHYPEATFGYLMCKNITQGEVNLKK